MNFYLSKSIAGAVRRAYAVLVAVFFFSVVHAAQAEPGRWLLVFDTSSAMKKRLPATAEAASRFLTTSADGHMHTNDSVAVWTYSDQLGSNQLPPIAWAPARSGVLSSNLVSFLKRQRFQNESKLSSLQMSLARVIADSERLTIVIFCDGQSDIGSTPYDAGINQGFREGMSERKNHRQPFVLVLRTQLGKYVGCSLNYPPGGISIPSFPELPPAPKVIAPVSPKSLVAPAAEVPSLVIVGTKVGTNVNAVPPVAHLATATNIAVPTARTNAVLSHTNPPVAPVIAPPVEAEDVVPSPVVPPTNNSAKVAAPAAPSASVTNPPVMAVVSAPVATQAVVSAVAPVATPVAAPDKADQQTRLLIWVGIGLLTTAIVLVAVLLARTNKRPRSSLITSSMQDAPPRRK